MWGGLCPRGRGGGLSLVFGGLGWRRCCLPGSRTRGPSTWPESPPVTSLLGPRPSPGGSVPPQGAAWPEEDSQHCPGVFTGRQVSQPAVSHRGASRKGAQSHSAARELARCTVRPGLGPSRPRREFAKRAHPKGGVGRGAVLFNHTALAWNKIIFPKLYSIAKDLQRTPFNIRAH